MSKPNYIDAAFLSSYEDEAYLFMKDEYVLVNYAPGSTHGSIVNGPLRIVDGFPSLANTPFATNGVDCAFDCVPLIVRQLPTAQLLSTAYIFSGNLCAHINYAPHTKEDKILSGPMTITSMFPFFKGTMFENGIDAAFRSSDTNEAYVFKKSYYAHIDYESKHLIQDIQLISKGFPSLVGTIFQSGVDAAFASHRDDEAYLFKREYYVLIDFSPGTTNNYLIGGGVKQILDYWPSLHGKIPRSHGGTQKPCYIEAAFLSSYKDEAYLFMNDVYVLLNYAPESTRGSIVNGPLRINDGFPSLANTPFEGGIDCAFDCLLLNTAYIFCGKLCAYINYAPHTTYDKILSGPKRIISMFPFFRGTVFQNGIDAAFSSSKTNEAYLFKGSYYARIDYESKELVQNIQLIRKGFPCLVGTVFEKGFDAAFASHRKDEAYLFKGEYYVRINFAPGTTNDYIIGGGVKRILDHWPSLRGIIPRYN